MKNRQMRPTRRQDPVSRNEGSHPVPKNHKTRLPQQLPGSPPGGSTLPSAERLARIEKRKARNRAFSLTLLVLLIMVITVFAIVLVMRQARPRPRFIFIQPGEIAQTVTLPGLVARDEQLFLAGSSGLLKPLITEGSRAAKNQKLALIIPSGREDQLRELQKCEKDIIDLQNELMQQGKGAGARAVYDESAASLTTVVSLIRHDLIRHDLSSISAYQTAMTIILEQRTARLMPIDFQDARLTALKQTRDALEQSLGLEAATLVSQKPGMVSFKLDGYEADLNNNALLTLSADALRSHIEERDAFLKISETIEKDRPVLRVFSGLYQSLAFIIPGNQTAVFPVDSWHTLISTDGGQTIENCQVVRAEKTGDDTLVVLRTDRSMEWLSDRRVIRAQLTLNRTEGLKVPYNALLDYDEETGRASLMLVIKGVARKCRVQVNAYDSSFAIVASVEGEEHQPTESAILVVNPESIEEGEFIGS